jgi:hypothetical protein
MDGSDLLTPLETASNYGATAGLHILKITTAPAKPFLSLVCLNQLFPGNGF